ncbi:hypothetical protein KSP35_20630 [Aquihabitans sp. G128]|uniref:hypothetical protein n=1 Tax=Aquihabitans sp. G128 TaxID=2849779 RepID=UPI001C21EDD8|nr:hypothetical protein [Aquihabitans sp. G128]QXC60699.1 hypothetical protein KSP35_20630 [Aquihabitans sp. G128]
MADQRYEVFRGEICGFGTASGHRVVVGRWPDSPFGPFADVMHEAPDGTRTLLAPTTQVAEFVEGTYTFDQVRIVPVVAERTATTLHVEAGDLVADVGTGRRSAVGWLLRAVPGPIARSTWWCTLIDPIARVVLRGVRTRGTAGNGRHEWYGATDQHQLTDVRATLAGDDLGALADVWPPVRFGFSSTPRTPSMVAVTTTIRHAEPT